MLKAAFCFYPFWRFIVHIREMAVLPPLVLCSNVPKPNVKLAVLKSVVPSLTFVMARRAVTSRNMTLDPSPAPVA